MKDGAVLLIGASSAIGRALGHELAARGARLYLAARNDVELERIGADLRTRYQVPITCGHFDAGDRAGHAAFLTDAMAALGGLDLAVMTVGELGDQRQAEVDIDTARRIIDANYTGIVSILTLLANRFEQQRHGMIVVLSSVAADRGRRANYVYGSAKAGLEHFLQGLRLRLIPANVGVLTVKPGLVDSRMTFGRMPTILVAGPSRVARAIIRAIDRKRRVIYVPWCWYWIMLAVRALPDGLLRRIPL